VVLAVNVAETARRLGDVTMNESAWLFIKTLISEFAWLLIRMLGMFFVGLLIMQVDISIRYYEGWDTCEGGYGHIEDCGKSDNVKYSRLLFLSASAYYFLRRGKFVHNLLVSGEKKHTL
jgi:hypothetical protein